jgi:hypothetical protein
LHELCRGVIRKTIGATKTVLDKSLLRKESAGREPPFREHLSAELEEFPLLKAVTREWL